MTTPRFDVTPFIVQDEGQHFDRKSLFEGPEGAKHPRDRRTVRDQVAEYVAAFANAEGGVLILGIEDGGVVTGHRYPDDAVRAILETPRTRLRPPQSEGFIVEHQGIPLLVFDVSASDVAVQVDGDGFPLRMGHSTVQASESQIEALKFRGLAESWEAQPSRLTMADLDSALLTQARETSGLAALSDEEYLLKRKLADRRGTKIALRRAAELVFAIDGPDHPNAGARIFRVIGTERRVGIEHNVEEKPRIEGNLPSVVASVFTVIESFIRRPSRMRGIRFQEMPEYPEYSWKEVVLNALAHRDYSVEGRTTEVWFFDDRLEVSSPGGLIPDLTLEELLRLERRHMSRNPRTVRALVDLAIMRDQGEGIPRMFAEMEGAFLPAPSIEARERELVVTLRNTPTLTEADKTFVGSLGLAEISDVEFRALLEAHRRGRIDNARLRDMTGLDTLAASALLRRLRDRDLLTLHAAGPASFYELGPAVEGRPTSGRAGDDLDRGGLETELGADRGGFGADRGGFGADRGGFGADQGNVDDNAEVRRIVSALGARPRKAKLREAIIELTLLHPWRPIELAEVLGFSPDKLVERHLKDMVDDGALERTHADNPSHPAQAYRAKKPSGQ
jgi:ATP-dependent DNA helicase RecG